MKVSDKNLKVHLLGVLYEKKGKYWFQILTQGEQYQQRAEVNCMNSGVQLVLIFINYEKMKVKVAQY